MPDLETLQVAALAARKTWSDALVSYPPGELADGNMPPRGVRSGALVVEAVQFGARQGFRYRLRGRLVSEATARAALAGQGGGP